MFKWKSTARLAAAASILALIACSSDNGTDPVDPISSGTENSSSSVVEETSVLSGSIEEDMTLTADKVWELQGFVYVADGVTLTIEKGTKVASIEKSALIIERGGKIMAEGTAAEPIVMTSKASAPQKGDWAGVVVMGKAPVSTEDNTSPFEANPEDIYGGDDAADNSGVMKYVRIEYAGWEVAPDKELNGLTLGGVGTGTEISYIHVHEGQDDGIEWFGGTVSSDHLVVTNQGDDGFDIDIGYTGTSQYMINIQDEGSNSGIEAGDKAFDGNNTVATWSNITLIDNAEDKDATLNIKDNVQINFDKVLMIGQESPNGLKVSGDVTLDLMKTGTSTITNSFYAGTFTNPITTSDAVLDSTLAAAIPQIFGAVNDDLSAAAKEITDAEAGAIVGGDLWYQGWITPGSIIPQADPAVFVGEIAEDITLDASTVYELEGFVYVRDGVTLTVPAGTVFKSQGKSALIVERGGKLIAEGTASNPVVFTSKAESPIKGDWAGIVIMGKAPVSTEDNTSPFEANPEDVYGGTVADDSSGSLKYVRIEYAGWEVAPDKELNGLTLGGVGSKTVISYVQVHEGQDDGFEWFGGTVDGDHLIATNQGDDGFDIDIGYVGSAEYLLNVQDDGSNSGIEAGDKAFDGNNTVATWSKITIVDNAEDKDASINIKDNVQINFTDVVMVGNTSPNGFKVSGDITLDLINTDVSTVENAFYTGTFTTVEVGPTATYFTEDADAVDTDGFTLKSGSAAATAGAGAVVEGDTWHTGWTVGL